MPQDMGDMEDIILELRRKIEVLETQNNKLRQENGSLAAKALDADQRYGQNTQETQMLKSEIENMRDLLKKADDERDKLRKKVTDMSKMSRMGHEDKNKEIERLKDKVAAMDRLVLKSGQEIKDLTEKIPNLLQDKKDLKEALEQVKKEKADLEKDVNLMQDAAHTVELKLKVTSEELANVKIELEEERDRNSGNERISTIDTLEKLNHKLKLEIQAQRQTAIHAERRLKDAEEQLAMLRVDLDEQVEEMEKAMMDASKYKEMNKKLETENKILMTESEELREQIRTMVDDKVDLQITKDQKLRIEDDAMAMRRKIADLTEKLGTMEETAKSLMIMAKEKQRHNDEFLNEINKVKNQNKQFKKQLDEKDNFLKKRVEFEELELPLPAEDKMGERDLKISHKKLMDENRRLRTMLAMKSMAEQNGITQVSNLEEKLLQKEEELVQIHGRSQRLEEWLDEIFNNRKYQLILKDEYDKMGEKLEGKGMHSHNKNKEGFPEIPQNTSLVTPRTTPDNRTGKDITPRQPTRGAPTPRGPSQAAPTPGPFAKLETQMPQSTGYSTNRGRLNGTYSRRK